MLYRSRCSGVVLAHHSRARSCRCSGFMLAHCLPSARGRLLDNARAVRAFCSPSVCGPAPIPARDAVRASMSHPRGSPPCPGKSPCHGRGETAKPNRCHDGSGACCGGRSSRRRRQSPTGSRSGLDCMNASLISPPRRHGAGQDHGRGPCPRAHADARTRPMMEVDQTHVGHRETDAFDPKATCPLLASTMWISTCLAGQMLDIESHTCVSTLRSRRHTQGRFGS